MAKKKELTNKGIAENIQRLRQEVASNIGDLNQMQALFNLLSEKMTNNLNRLSNLDTCLFGIQQAISKRSKQTGNRGILAAKREKRLQKVIKEINNG